VSPALPPKLPEVGELVRTGSHRLCLFLRVRIRLHKQGRDHGYQAVTGAVLTHQRSALARRSPAEVRGGPLLSHKYLAWRPTPADKLQNPSPEHEAEPAAVPTANATTNATANATANTSATDSSARWTLCAPIHLFSK